ncbi:MAG: hypothetical protein NXI30_08855 [bacterium]|nr:hypothetical protein [bacterium]
MDGPFRADGPRLPIEFSRVAHDGRVTLVIDEQAVAIPTWAVALDVDGLDAAIEALGRRERIGSARWPSWIGAQLHAGSGGIRGEASEATRDAVSAWLPGSGYDGVVWTALPSRCPDGRFAAPRTGELVDHLRALEGEARARAEEYIRRAPPTVRTERRARFEAELGWTASEAPPNPPTPGVPEAPPDAPMPGEGS